MTKHTIPKPLLGTSRRWSLGKWRIVSCALVFTLGPMTCFAQTGSVASAPPAPASSAASTDLAKELDAMKKRIEELEAQIAKDKEKDKPKDQTATAPAAPAATTPAAAPAPATETRQVLTASAPASTPAATAQPAGSTAAPVQNVATYTTTSAFWKRWLKGQQAKAAAQPAPVTTASLSTPPASAFDLKANEALNPDAPFPAGPQDAGQAPAAGAAPAPAAPPPVDLQTPFAFADFTWMMAVPRNHDSVFDGKYFSGEFRWDTNYIYDLWHPIDHTLDGTTEGTRTGEVVLQALNVGGDFHWDHMQGRILLQIGADATAVPRNDASANVGQWDIADAYRYISEGYAGYHMDVQHGLNIQAGIFMSYIGLFSYYSFDNWTYQPSYVSSNTPWFFNGARVQWFPTNKLKFEPWLINGWQSYGKFNGKPGIGGQILWRPSGNWDFVWNTYALGQDTLNTHRTRLHEDDSLEYKEYENPNRLMHRAGLTFTFDIGCETGGGQVVVDGTTPAAKVACFSNHTTGKYAGNPVYAQNFIGAMAYQRFWFNKDHEAITFGGGWISNPGGYLVLLPPVNGANAISGSPYFTNFGNPGQNFAAYDFQVSFDWMPTQFVTWQAGFTQRGANVPYFTGPGGITPPGGNQGAPGSLAYYPNGQLWEPDLRKEERRFIFALMVHL
jgi:hypothetical protein